MKRLSRLLGLLCSFCHGAFHVRNQHQGRYDFSSLRPALNAHIVKNKFNNEDTIDWKDEKAVRALNTALLKTQYNVSEWLIPEGFLVPPIPSR